MALIHIFCSSVTLPRRTLMASAVKFSELKPIVMDASVGGITGAPSPKVSALAEQIVTLNMVEVAELVDVLKVKLNLTALDFGGGMMSGGSAPSAGGDQAAAVPAKKEEKKEKTEFGIKLDSFNAADKLKVIKEIRSITGLGLKESKDLVEGAPKVVKEGLSKDDAEKLKKQIEDAGGKVTIS